MRMNKKYEPYANKNLTWNIILSVDGLKIKGKKKVYYENTSEESWSGFTSDKTDFKTKTIARDKEAHYIKGSICQKKMWQSEMHLYLTTDLQNTLSKNWHNSNKKQLDLKL